MTRNTETVTERIFKKVASLRLIMSRLTAEKWVSVRN